MKKSSSLIYFLGSVGLIIVAIVFTAFIDRTRSTGSTNADIRARAENKGALQMTGRISSVNQSSNIIVVDNLQFDDNPQDLGTWSVTPGPNVNLGSLLTGANASLSVEAETFSIENHTLIAREIRMIR